MLKENLDDLLFSLGFRQPACIVSAGIAGVVVCCDRVVGTLKEDGTG